MPRLCFTWNQISFADWLRDSDKAPLFKGKVSDGTHIYYGDYYRNPHQVYLFA